MSATALKLPGSEKGTATVPRPRKKVSPKTYVGRVAICVRKARESTGMDVKKAAKAAGISIPVLYHYENGTKTPSIEALYLMAIGWGVDVWSLLPPSEK